MSGLRGSFRVAAQLADATAAGASNSGGSCDAGDLLWPLEMSLRAVCSKDIRPPTMRLGRLPRPGDRPMRIRERQILPPIQRKVAQSRRHVSPRDRKSPDGAGYRDASGRQMDGDGRCAHSGENGKCSANSYTKVPVAKRSRRQPATGTFVRSGSALASGQLRIMDREARNGGHGEISQNPTLARQAR